MDIDVTQQDDWTRIVVSGEIDADNCGELGRALPTEPLGSPVLLNLAGLSFIDSSGISELLRVRDTVVGAGQEFRIEDPSPAVLRVLEITGLIEIFGLAD